MESAKTPKYCPVHIELTH